jgi:hypothetical protein
VLKALPACSACGGLFLYRCWAGRYGGFPVLLHLFFVGALKLSQSLMKLVFPIPLLSVLSDQFGSNRLKGAAVGAAG